MAVENYDHLGYRSHVQCSREEQERFIRNAVLPWIGTSPRHGSKENPMKYKYTNSAVGRGWTIPWRYPPDDLLVPSRRDVFATALLL